MDTLMMTKTKKITPIWKDYLEMRFGKEYLETLENGLRNNAIN